MWSRKPRHSLAQIKNRLQELQASSCQFSLRVNATAPALNSSGPCRQTAYFCLSQTHSSPCRMKAAMLTGQESEDERLSWRVDAEVRLTTYQGLSMSRDRMCRNSKLCSEQCSTRVYSAGSPRGSAASDDTQPMPTGSPEAGRASTHRSGTCGCSPGAKKCWCEPGLT